MIRVAEKCVEYSELTSDYNIALKGAYLYTKGGNIDTGIEEYQKMVQHKMHKFLHFNFGTFLHFYCTIYNSDY